MTTYRVWIRNPSGDHYYHTFKSLSKAVEFSRNFPNAEPPLLDKGRSLLTSREYAVPHHKILRALGRKNRKQRRVYTSGELFGGALASDIRKIFK